MCYTRTITYRHKYIRYVKFKHISHFHIVSFQGKEVLLYYIQEILAEGETDFPTWSELYGEEDVEKEESKETHLPIIKENENLSTPKRNSTLVKQLSVRDGKLQYHLIFIIILVVSVFVVVDVQLPVIR